MADKCIMVGTKRMPLEEVARENDKKLYRFQFDGIICGAPISVVKEEFPSFDPSGEDVAMYEYLVEENGELQLYDIDGEPVDGFELITEEEINKI